MTKIILEFKHGEVSEDKCGRPLRRSTTFPMRVDVGPLLLAAQLETARVVSTILWELESGFLNDVN